MAESRTDIVIRRASESDAQALRRLAALDAAPTPNAGSRVLIAEIAGTPVAALDGERAIADPFVPTAPVVDLLRLRAAQLAAASGDTRRRARRLRLRSRTAPVPPRPLPLG